ncbi:hypothetical protein [Actinoplanes derwentensis]|uniref:Uncharacterized protein n=1 Tax=Actinoplanes derwentensis TaxID=113562 RepID=A0A1H2D2X4_9ACTN|nr:hypothetical protein [Actinoplanes derwentensis]GID88289.1 hypothetical protein Ade03nite_72130 [Actinoplanes derwentensis]SDT77101.1 hypothetical protein SAMN04489716_7830 [Actinoplanes derwentensis]
MTDLEARYRSLLRIYPAGHRAAYEEEMVGVLMAGAEPDRRFPSPADAMDLVRAGLTVRLGSAFHTQRGTGWRSAAAVVGLFAALVLAGVGVSRLSIGLAEWSYGDPKRLHGIGGLLLLDPVARTLVWTLVAGAAVLGLRRATVRLAAAGVLVQAGAICLWAGPGPWQALRMAWGLALALVALALFAVAASGRPVRAVLGGRGLVLVAAGVGFAALMEALGWNRAWFRFWYSEAGPSPLFPIVHYWVPGLFLVLAVAGIIGARRRIAVLSAVVVAIPVAFQELEQVAHWSLYFDLTPAIVMTGVVVLVLTPITVFGAGVAVLWAGASLAARRHGHVRAHE